MLRVNWGRDRAKKGGAMSVIDSMTMSAPDAPVKLVVRKPTNRLGRKEPNDDHYRSIFHPCFQQIALVDTETGEFQERRLAHREEAERFDRALAGQKVRVGMEASAHARWFERLVAELQFELRNWRRGRDPHEAGA